jgi:phospholipid/cholesterol/gamma-HCH transport system substrate-binding protein
LTETPSQGKKESSPIARYAALAAIVVVAVGAALILMRGGGEGHYTLLFENAGQLVKGDDVQVGGRRAGTIEDISLTSNAVASVKIRVDKEFSPLHQGTTAVIRQTSLSGIANRYIALSLGPNSGQKIKDGGVIGTEKTTTPVDLDQLFNTLDPRTRKALQNVVNGSAAQYQGVGRQTNIAGHYFAPALSQTDDLVKEVLTDQQSFTDFVVNSSKLVTALAARRDDLSSLVSNANATTAAIAAENTSLDRALAIFPQTLRRGNTTFVNLRSTLDDLDVLVNASKPATRRLAPFLRELRPLVAAARPTIADLRRLVRTKGPNNDLTDALLKQPALQRVASPAFQTSLAALQKSQPVLQFIRPYAPELVGWIRDFGFGASSYDANGHYARIQPIINNYSLVDTPLNGVSLIPQGVNDRLTNLKTFQVLRCPGAATQPAQDGSAPFRDNGTLDCDPSQHP